MKIPTRVNTEDATHPGLQHTRRGICYVVIALFYLSTRRKVRQTSTDSAKKGLGLSENRHTSNFWERENDSHSLHGGSIPQSFSNHNRNSIEQIELDTTRKKVKENGRNRIFVSLPSGAARPLPVTDPATSLAAFRTASGAQGSRSLALWAAAPRSMASRGQVPHIRACPPLVVAPAIPSTSTSRGGYHGASP